MTWKASCISRIEKYGSDHCGSFMVTAEIFSHILCAMKSVLKTLKQKRGPGVKI